MRYTVVLQRDEDDPEIWCVEVPSLPGCHTWGRGKRQALTRAKEAIEGHIEMLDKIGEPIPEQLEEIENVEVFAR